MRGTDELREWASVEVPYKYGHQLLAIANRIDAEHEEALLNVHTDLMDASGWIRLPKDADGEYIRIGDELDYLEALHTDVPARFKVQDMFYYGDGKWHLRAYPATYEPEKCRHYHAPTVEDVLRQVIACANNGQHVHGALATEDIIAEYAAKLRLAEEDA